MKQGIRRIRRSRRVRRPEEAAAAGPSGSSHSVAGPEPLGPYYNTGPAHTLPQHATGEGEVTAQEEEETTPTPAPEEQPEAAQAQETQVAQEPEPVLPTLTTAGQGEPEQVTAYQRGPLRLNGRTDATYDGGTYSTQNVRVRPGSGCSECSDCIHVTGTLVARYSVSTTVTLPSVNDFPDLTACQRRRVQNAITSVLAPHEQEHVRAFQRYNGTTRRRFDLTLCRTEFDGAIDAMFQAEERARRAAAQAASDALDPFNFDVDLNCEDHTSSLEGEAAPIAETPPPEEEEPERVS